MYKGDIKHEDGYRLHINPDGSSVFLEGVEPKNDALDVFRDGTANAINNCIRRRGLEFKETPMRSGHEQHKMRHLNKIHSVIKLEHALCGEEDW